VTSAHDKPPVYLTFDDGPYPATTDVLNALQEVAVKATFFLCMKNLESRNDLQFSLIKRMLAEGHSLGNHGYDHDPMTKKGYRASSTDAVKKDFTDNVSKLEVMFAAHHTPFPGFKVARLPGDGRTFPEFVRMICHEVHLPHAGWDFEFADNGRMPHVGAADWQGVAGVAATSKQLPRANDILLLHDLHWKGKGDRLVRLIRKLQENFRVRSLVPIPPNHPRIRYS
jgi:peptidoglycan/xylan/chitin deacetylase (PgdA/CDA1 family)